MVGKQAIGVSILALAAALGSGAAHAVPTARTVTAMIADYNAAQVAQANGVLTVPAANYVTYTVTHGSLELNSRFTVTLPSGFSFGSQPSFSAGPTTPNATSLALFSGGIGSQTATFVIQGAPLATAETLTLNSFAVQGATALETLISPDAALPISMQATNNSLIDNDDPAPISAGFFASEPGIGSQFEGFPALIDLSPPSLGTQFVELSTDTPATTPILVLELFQETDVPTDLPAPNDDIPVLSPNGTLNTLADSDEATVTVPGDFTGIAAAFIAGDDTCSGSTLPATVTPTQITIPNIPGGFILCVTADGKTLMHQNLAGFAPVVSPLDSTDFYGVNAQVLGDFPGFITYAGGGVITVTNFFTGDDSGYSSLVRVNNPSSDATTLFALVQPDTGGAPLVGEIGTLAGGTGTVYTEQQIQAAVPGLSLANSGQRAALQLIFTGPELEIGSPNRPALQHRIVSSGRGMTNFAAQTGPHGTAHLATQPRLHVTPQARPEFFNGAVTATGLLVNPNGVVTQMPGQVPLELPR